MSEGVLKIAIVLVGQGSGGGSLQLGVVLRHELLINLHFRRCKCWRSSKLEGRVANELASKPEEWLLEVVVGFRRDLEVLQVLLSVECDSTCLYFPFLDVYLVAAKHNRNVFTYSLQITVPVGHVLVRDSTCDIEHNDTTLALNVIAIAKTTELLLPRGVPYIEADCAKVGVELQRVDLNTQSGNVLLLEFSGQVALYKSRLSGTSISNCESTWSASFKAARQTCLHTKHELEVGNFLSLSRHDGNCGGG